MEKNKEKKIIQELTESSYKYGFTSKLESDTIKKGLNEKVIKIISKKKGEPSWMLKKRLDALKILKKMSPPKWANLKFETIDLQNIIYYSAPKQKASLKSLDEVDPELIKTFNRKLPYVFKRFS